MQNNQQPEVVTDKDQSQETQRSGGRSGTTGSKCPRYPEVPESLKPFLSVLATGGLAAVALGVANGLDPNKTHAFLHQKAGAVENWHVMVMFFAAFAVLTLGYAAYQDRETIKEWATDLWAEGCCPSASN